MRTMQKYNLFGQQLATGRQHIRSFSPHRTHSLDSLRILTHYAILRTPRVDYMRRTPRVSWTKTRWKWSAIEHVMHMHTSCLCTWVLGHIPQTHIELMCTHDRSIDRPTDRPTDQTNEQTNERRSIRHRIMGRARNAFHACNETNEKKRFTMQKLHRRFIDSFV